MAVSDKTSTSTEQAGYISTKTYATFTETIFRHKFIQKNRIVIITCFCAWILISASSAILTQTAKSNFKNNLYNVGVQATNQMCEKINEPLLAKDILTLNLAMKILNKKLNPIFAAILDHTDTAIVHSDSNAVNKQLSALNSLNNLTSLKKVIIQKGNYNDQKTVITFSKNIVFAKVRIGQFIFGLDADKIDQANARYNILFVIIMGITTLLFAGALFIANKLRLRKEAKDLAAFEKMEIVGPYTIQKKIAQGGMAELYIAHHILEDGFKRTVAIKKILPHLAQDEDFVTMFIREARLAAMLQHPNIVPIYDLIKINNGSFMAMEYVEGKNLAEILAYEKKELPVDMTIFIIQKICSGLYYSHSKTDDKTGEALNIVHRDISPQNILISYKGEVKISDFGISKAKSEPSFTQIGVIKGKLSYLSPEQALGKEGDHQADIYALGLIFYEMLTGKRTYRFDNELEAIRKIPSMIITPVIEIRPDIPKELNHIVGKCLEKDQSVRYQTGKELHDNLIKLKNRLQMTYDETNLTDFLVQRFRKPTQ